MKSPNVATLEHVVAVRPCGGCVACCLTVPVHEIAKRAFQRCPMLREPFDRRGPGCGVYHEPGKFPRSCHSWSCIWATSDPEDLPDAARPDRCGVIMDPIIDLSRQVSTGREIPSAQLWVLPGFEESFQTSELVRDLIWSLLQRVEVVLWRLPPGADGIARGRSFHVVEGQIGVGPVTEFTLDMEDAERFARVDEIMQASPDRKGGGRRR